MAGSTFFVQPCPTCGRNLEVRVRYLGRPVICRHCNAKFEACDPSSAIYPPPNSRINLVQRAEALIQRAETDRRQRP
jgi:hypothetical protein